VSKVPRANERWRGSLEVARGVEGRDRHGGAFRS
jgi:hypothetical protein